ncbi:phage antirepressor KilAC domain-containing protein [Dyadobacter sp. LHD-138]|uniref:phage antirepressor KilAC domain-containing protein n=1 Tax=Dyadobacter sp. LHD-138 TaxID=3071413 RepID=UPI0027E1E7E4|nr:phage antirepressor KilAC domain-containing protein [Dyadobacter sp. LHD-138]MDQ6477840.1 phage antirepressor KilAC domain-containing protein [Dyadobacter sp. LHD-138]
MENLIPISVSEGGKNIISSRDLYVFLEVKRDFTNWCKQMFDYGFEEGKDFTPILAKSTGGRPSIDYAITLDSAKEISMIQRTAKGKQARQYFIACEKRLKEVVAGVRIPQTLSEALQLAADQARKIEEQTKQIQSDKPKVIFADAVSVSNDAILVGEMAKILKQNGVNMGQNRFFEWLRKNGYLISRSATDYNMPTQYAMERNLFKIKETSIAHSDGRVTIGKTAKITGEGQIHFINKFLKR